jgi:hypothetical protein
VSIDKKDKKDMSRNSITPNKELECINEQLKEWISQSTAGNKPRTDYEQKSYGGEWQQ